MATTLTNPDLTAAFNAAVSANAVRTINVSLGECELAAQYDGSAVTDDGIFELAIVQGQTFSVSSGDDGSNECIFYGNGSTGDSYPASSRYVISIGGTTLTNVRGVVSEVAWGGGGGGPSDFEPIPSWQVGTVNGTTRGVPDLAFDADPNTGAEIILNGQGMGVGGTSLASPIFVGLLARLEAAFNNTLPFPVQWIYKFPTTIRSQAFHDVTSGTNGGYKAAVGWDYTTGWGSLSAANARQGIQPAPIETIIDYLLDD